MTERATRIRAGELSPRTRAHAAGDEILLLNGPSLNLLGEREPERYGTTTLDEIETRVAAAAEAAGMTLVDSFQSNHEGDLIDRLHVRDFSWVIINPGGLTTPALASAMHSWPSSVHSLKYTSPTLKSAKHSATSASLRMLPPLQFVGCSPQDTNAPSR